ncbi:MAG: LysM peptidoglycan-binding domain-containing protein [Anaerolineaceae bacterium]|nr:LysM peptidoglycan-binding domain-containing protein [Anaerolineaceae bacterium]
MRTVSRLSIIFAISFLLLAGVVSRGAAAPSAQAGTQVPRATSTATGGTDLPIIALVTSTPDQDGAVIHVVQSGQTLITIATAYGISLNDLKTLNNLTSDSINIGEKLFIRKGATPTITSTVTRTATTTSKPSSTPRPRTPTDLPGAPTVTPAWTATPRPPMIDLGGNRQALGVGIIAVCALGLVVVGLTLFRKR